MADREKVIKTIQNRVNEARNKQLKVATIFVSTLSDVLTLLKEQEAVEPMKEHSGSGVTWWNICGNCKTAINPNDKYCHECGRSVKWE